MTYYAHDFQLRRAHNASLRLIRGALIAAAVAVAAVVAPVRAADSTSIALHLAPGRYQRTEKLVHLVKYDLNKTLRNMLGTKANDQTILEDRTRTLTVRTGGAVSESETNTRRFAGDNPKDKTIKTRSVQYDGTIASNGDRTPAQSVLEDAGDGALDQLPSTAIAPGQSWTFTRNIKTDRELGEGQMTYTDTLTGVEDRNGHRIAMISVTGTGRITPPSDLEAKGFKTATMTFKGNAEFDTTTGLPGVQHYTGNVEWGTKVMWTRIGVIFDDTYDATALTIATGS